MNTIKFENSEALQNFETLCATIGWDMDDERSMRTFKAIFAGVTDVLNIMKSKTLPKAVVIQDMKNNRYAAAICQFIDGEGDDAGSWTYVWTFNMDEIPENAEIITLDQSSAQKIIMKRALSYDIRFANGSFIATLAVYMLKIIKDYLDQQDVANGDSLSMSLDGYFVATVEVNEDRKVFSLVPAGEIKTLIKNDDDSEDK